MKCNTKILFISKICLHINLPMHIFFPTCIQDQHRMFLKSYTSYHLLKYTHTAPTDEMAGYLLPMIKKNIYYIQVYDI